MSNQNLAAPLYSEPSPLPNFHPVTAGAENLASTLLFNAGLRFLRDQPHDAWKIHINFEHWDSLLTQARSLTAQGLLTPEDQIICHHICEATEICEAQIRLGYRRAYFTEMAEHQTTYFEYFVLYKVPTAILQSLQALCDHERLLRGIEHLLPQTQ
ncbi:MAG: hypothetical protein JXQ85_07695 [Cognatishimia sp.]|uniref:hypothetical protein n=1 Tax=Cognatishimia sp. TaxID=2211648 RepID=UPI003B8D77F5